MIKRVLRRVRFWHMAAIILLLPLTSVITDANAVTPTHAVDTTQSQGANDQKPTACSAVTLTAKIVGTGTINGTSASELIVGDQNGVTINGGDGDDCIIGGAGNDHLIGGPGFDVCIGNGGTDVFDPSCEVQVP